MQARIRCLLLASINITWENRSPTRTWLGRWPEDTSTLERRIAVTDMVHQLETSNYSYMHTGKYVNYIQFVWTIATLYYSTLILGVFLLHQIAHVGVSKGIGLKLFGSVGKDHLWSDLKSKSKSPVLKWFKIKTKDHSCQKIKIKIKITSLVL